MVKNLTEGRPLNLLFFFALGFQLALLISSKVTSVTLITFIEIGRASCRERV